MSSSPAGPPAPTPPGPDASPGAVVRWTFDVLNTHHAAPLRAVWTDETRERMPTATYRGPDEIEGYFDRLFAAVPDATLTMQGMAEQGDDVFVRWTLTGTHTGAAFEGIEPTGVRIDLDGVDHFTVRGGKIASNFVIFDQMQFARQVGLLPADGSRIDIGMKRGFNLLQRLRG